MIGRSVAIRIRRVASQIPDVVISGDGVKRGLEPARYPIEFVPFRFEQLGVIGGAADHVAEVHHQYRLRLQPVDLIDVVLERLGL